MRRLWLLFLLLVAGCASSPTPAPKPAPAPSVWLSAVLAAPVGRTTNYALTYPPDMTNRVWFIEGSDDGTNWTVRAANLTGAPAGTNTQTQDRFYRLRGANQP